MNSNKIGTVKDHNILFLQGPMGPFFKKLDQLLSDLGANTYKIGFNVSDYFYSRKRNYTPFRGKPKEWQSFIKAFLQDHHIQKIFLFGDCRFYQRIAIEEARRLNIDVFVFEEGYVRPDYITLEKFGVNNFSQISRDPAFYENLNIDDFPVKEAIPAGTSRWQLFQAAIIYYLFANLFKFRYPHYQHHREFSARKEFIYGAISVFRKQYYKFSEKQYRYLINGPLKKKYFFIPLQTHNDFQILEHSGYKSIEKFIIEVIESFAAHAKEEHFLVFKHHPVDRGRRNYANFIYEQAALYNIKERMIVFHDVYLPLCLDHAIGTVTINSTVGLTSLSQGIPTITLGNCIYDIEGLTAKGVPLETFWHTPLAPNMQLLQKFKNYLITTTQLNGSYYGMFPDFTKVLK